MSILDFEQFIKLVLH